MILENTRVYIFFPFTISAEINLQEQKNCNWSEIIDGFI